MAKAVGTLAAWLCGLWTRQRDSLVGEFNSHTLSSSLVAQVDWNDERFVPLVVYEVAGAAVCRLYLGEHMQQRHAISAACAACQHMRIALWDAPDAIT